MELNEFLKKLNNSKESAHLSAERKKAIRGRILYLINLSEKPKVKTASFFFPILRPMPIMAGVLALVLAGGTISFAAEGSLPGEILYPVKININENLIAAVKFTPVDRASWEVDKTERRLSEASALIAKGEIDLEAQTQIEDSFEKTAGIAQDGIQDLEKQGNATTAADVAARLEAVLKAHKQILAVVRDEKPTTTAASLENKLSDRIVKLEAVKAAIQAKIAMRSEKGVDSDAKKGIQKAKDRIDSVKKFVENNSEKLSIGDVKGANRKLSAASQGVTDAEDQLKGDLAGEAFNSANDAGEEAHKLEILLQAGLSLGIPTPDDSAGSSPAAAATIIQSSSTETTSTPGN